MKKQAKYVQNLVLAAMFLAIGMVLPFFTGQIPKLGNMLLPMHIPVMVCGLICGWGYGGAVGFVLPLLRYAVFGRPPMPNGIGMAFELAAYGAIAGFLYNRSKWKCIVALYKALLTAMVCGRLVWGTVMLIITGAAGNAFTWQMFIAGAFFNAIPGIILQLVFIPSLMVVLDKTGLVRFCKSKPPKPSATE